MNSSFDQSPQDTPAQINTLSDQLPARSASALTEHMQSEEMRSGTIIAPKLSLGWRPDTSPGLSLFEPTLDSAAWRRSKERTTDKVILPRLSLKMRGEFVQQSSFERQATLHPHGLVDDLPFNFNNSIFDADPEFDKRATIPVMVLTGIAAKQGQAASAMTAEISGATKNATLIGIGNMVGNALKYCSSFLIQRGFGAASFGLYALGMSVVSLVISVFNLGLDDAMVRYVSIYQSKKQAGRLRGLAIFCSAAAGGAGILGALFVFICAPYLAARMKAPELLTLLELMALLVPLSSIQGVWSGGLQGFKAFKWRLFSQRFVVPTVMIFLLLVVLIFYHHLQGVIVASIISTAVGTVLCLYFFLRKLSSLGSAREEPNVYEVREWLGFAVPNFMTSITDVVLDAIDTLLLAFFAISAAAIGRYAAANKISIFIEMPLLSLNSMFAPTIAELYSLGEKQKLAVMFKLVTKWTIIFSLPIFVIATLFSKSLLGISGEDFVAAWPLLIALSVGNLVNAGTGSVGYMLLMTGHQRLSFLNSLVALLVNLGLGIILTPRFGALGVATATGLALAIVNLMRLLQVRVLLKMHPYRWDVLKPLLAGVISALFTAGLLQITSHFNMHITVLHKNLSVDLALVPLFLVMYVGLIVLFKFDDEDKIVIETLRTKLKRGKK